MHVVLNEQEVKARTKRMVQYFREEGLTVPTGKLYEGLSRFFEFPSWNVMAAELKRAATQTMPEAVAEAGSAAAQPFIQRALDERQQKADALLARYDFGEFNTVEAVGNWTCMGVNSWECTVFIEHEKDAPGSPTHPVVFKVQFSPEVKPISVTAISKETRKPIGSLPPERFLFGALYFNGTVFLDKPFEGQSLKIRFVADSYDQRVRYCHMLAGGIWVTAKDRVWEELQRNLRGSLSYLFMQPGAAGLDCSDNLPIWA